MSSVTDALLQLRAKAQLSASNLRERKAQALAQLLAQQHAAEQNAGHTPSGEAGAAAVGGASCRRFERPKR